MSTVIARRVASTPSRSAAQTWEKIMDILAPDPQDPARQELASSAGVACASISSEATQEAAIIVWGGGPRVRVYCVFGEDAVSGDGVSEDALPRSAMKGDWRMSIPCPPEDVAWSSAKLAEVSTRISARSLEEEMEEDVESAPSSRSLAINPEEFFRP